MNQESSPIKPERISDEVAFEALRAGQNREQWSVFFAWCDQNQKELSVIHDTRGTEQCAVETLRYGIKQALMYLHAGYTKIAKESLVGLLDCAQGGFMRQHAPELEGQIQSLLDS